MRKEEICVLIDSEEKRLRALEILKKAGEEVWDRSELSKEFTEPSYPIGYSRFYGTWKLTLKTQNIITLDKLEELLLPNYAVKDVHLTIDELKQQAEKLGFELVEKKREIKVGDFGVFSDTDNPMHVYRSTLTKVKDMYADERGIYWDNFRHLTDEEKEQIQNNW